MELVKIPLLNANEDEVEVVGVHVSEGDNIKAGEPLCTIESTKAVAELDAPVTGFVRELAVEVGQRVVVGHLVCAITESPDEPVDLPRDPIAGPAATDTKATAKARKLAETHGIDLAEIGVDGIIKERDVRRHVEKSGAPSTATVTSSQPANVSESIVVYGSGGHARMLIDLIRSGYRGVEIVGVVDDDPDAKDVLGTPVLGTSDQLEKIRARGVETAGLGVGAITNNAKRIELFDKLRRHGFRIPNLIHPTAMVEPSVRMGLGNQIFAGATVGSNATLGNNTIINAGAVVSHDCEIGSHTHVTPGAILAGGVKVGENTLIGMGVTIYVNVRIGKNVTVSNGANIMKDVPDGTILRTASHWPLQES